MAKIRYFVDDLNIYFNQSPSSYVYVENDPYGEKVFSAEHKPQHLMKKDFSYFKSSTYPHPVSSGLMPPGVRYIGKNYVIFERPPTYKTVFYTPSTVEEMFDEDGNFDPEESRIYNIPVPWQLYIVFFDLNYYVSDVYMYFMNSHLTSPDQTLMLPALPNFYVNGMLCRPTFDSMDDIERYSKDIKGVIETAYDWVWDNGTNNDLTECVVHLVRQNLDGLIFQNIPQELREKYIRKIDYVNVYHFNGTQVDLIMSSWEKISMDDIIKYTFPNPSQKKHFDNSPLSYSHDDVPYEHLEEYISILFLEDTGDHPSSDDIEEIINSSDYSKTEYIEWLIQNDMYTPKPIPFEWELTSSYETIVNRLIQASYFSSHKKIFNLSHESMAYLA